MRELKVGDICISTQNDTPGMMYIITEIDNDTGITCQVFAPSSRANGVIWTHIKKEVFIYQYSLSKLEKVLYDIK